MSTTEETVVPKAKETYLRLLKYVRPFRRQFGFAVAGMIVYGLTDTGFAALMKPMLDAGFVERDRSAIALVPVLIIAIFIVRGLAGFASTYYMSLIGWNVIKSMRREIFDKYLSMPTQFFDNASSGELISKVTFNAQNVAQAASNTLTVLIRDSLTVLGLFGLMFYLSWKLSLSFLIIGPVIGFLINKVSFTFRNISRGIQDSMGDVSHVIEEAVEGQRVVKIFGGQEYERRQFELANENNRRLNMSQTLAKAANVPLIQLLIASALAVIIYLATSGSLIDEISPGTFMAFVSAMLMLFAPMRRLTTLNVQLQKGIAAGESLFALLDLPSERDTGTRELDSVQGYVCFEDVVFRYEAGKPPVLNGVSLTVNPGETVALVGESGSGKTSLVNLLPRLYEAESGRVTIDGIEIDELRLQSLREKITYVSQDVTLFNDTIANNIAYGALQEVPLAQIREAAIAAHADDFINGLPEGYNTYIGENGVMLSGGQRQRLAIARALLKNAQILILDEATSALDTESERKVQQGLDNLRQGRTTLVIAHRLSTIENADRIVVMHQGRIAEQGTHAELLAKGGQYAYLHKLQFQS
ncbi:lipid A export permease/ATP-binding protein MsbA [Granulosicoccaceae sp. 1_MG-2023]|nr:lipid A export permease/ATP-binding protein MsbA [Granulosicoccaceae sp. 1_MG-2023]